MLKYTSKKKKVFIARNTYTYFVPLCTTTFLLDWDSDCFKGEQSRSGGASRRTIFPAD